MVRKWRERDLIMLADIDHDTHGSLSAVKLSESLERRDIHLSKYTIRHMLTKIMNRCPLCGGKDRVHQYNSHPQKFPEATHISIR